MCKLALLCTLTFKLKTVNNLKYFVKIFTIEKKKYHARIEIYNVKTSYHWS